MAKQKNSSNGNSWKGFYNFYLDEGQKNGIKKLALGGQATFNRINELVDNNYKFGLSYSIDSKAYFATVTGRGKGHPNEGYSLTQGHADPAVAIAAVWLVVSEVHGWDSWPVNAEKDEWDW